MLSYTYSIMQLLIVKIHLYNEHITSVEIPLALQRIRLLATVNYNRRKGLKINGRSEYSEVYTCRSNEISATRY